MSLSTLSLSEGKVFFVNETTVAEGLLNGSKEEGVMLHVQPTVSFYSRSNLEKCVCHEIFLLVG